MTFTRRLLLCCGGGAGVWAVVQAGSLFCFFTYELIGKYLALPFFYLANWPNLLVQPFYPTQMPSWLQGLGWPISVLISLVGWLLLSVLIALIVHGALFFRRRDDVQKL